MKTLKLTSGQTILIQSDDDIETMWHIFDPQGKAPETYRALFGVSIKDGKCYANGKKA